MLRLAADENLNGDIVRGLLRRNAGLDIVRIQDVGLSGADDPRVMGSGSRACFFWRGRSSSSRSQRSSGRWES